MEIITFVFLLLAMQVQAQDVIEIASSGDGESSLFTSSYASLIDDNGDILNISTYDSISSTVLTIMDNESAYESVLYNSTTLSESTEDQSTSSTKFVETTMAFTSTSDSPTTTTNTPTTTSIVESTTTSEVPTTTETTTQTTTTTTTIKTTTMRPTTTTLSSTITEKIEPEPPTTPKTTQVPIVETTYIPASEGQQCTFMDDNLMCDEDIICYGEGEINCEEVVASPAETTFIDKISLSSVSEDYSDYEGPDDVETFPPYLVGVKPEKKRPFLFKMGSLESHTSTMGSDISDGIQEDIAATRRKMPSLPFIEKLASEKIYSKIEAPMKDDSVVPTSTVESTSVSHSSTKVRHSEPGVEVSVEKEPSSVVPHSPNKFVQETPAENTPSTEASSPLMLTMQDAIETVQNVTSQIMTALSTEASTPMIDDAHGKSVSNRRKRDENAALGSDSSMPLPFHMTASESSKKRRMRSCSLSGNIVCSPSPTAARCKGKTLCQVVSGTAETSEKSTSPKGVENWAIAVIAICAIAAALTISLLIYLVFTSWKKLKVQPQNGVTTLNYVNSSVP